MVVYVRSFLLLFNRVVSGGYVNKEILAIWILIKGYGNEINL